MSASDVPKAGPLERRPLSFLAAAAWTAAAGLLMALAMGFTEAARPGARTDLVNQTACELFVYSALILVMLRVYEPTTRMRDVLAARPTSIVGTLLAVAGGAALYPALNAIDDLFLRLLPLHDEELEMVAKLTETTTLTQRIVLFVAYVVVGPLCEGFFFHGVIYGGLRRGRISLLAVAGTTAFYAMWRDPRVYVSMIALGLLLAWLRSRSGSVVPGILANMSFNAVPLPLMFTGRGSIDFPIRWIAIGAVVGVAAAFLATLFFARNERALAGRLADG